MPKKLLVMMLVMLLALPAAVHAADEDAAESVTRGEFFRSIAEHLELKPEQSDLPLPSDVPNESPYAESVRALMEKQVLFGYPDGTVRPDEEIQAEHAAYLLARLLGVEDAQAVDFLNEKYGVNLTGSAKSEEARQSVARVLSTDPATLDLIKQSTVKQLEVTSFKAVVDQSMRMEFRPDAPAELAGLMSDITATSEMVYHLEDGMHLITTMKLPEIPMEEGAIPPEGIAVEQYMVPEGMFMKITDPSTGEDQWISMGDLPFSFPELQQMQQSSMGYIDELMNMQTVFYRTEGVETVNGAPAHKIGFNGTIASLEDIMKMMQSFMPNQESGSATDLLAGLGDIFKDASFAGTMWLNQETLLPIRAEMTMSMQLADNPALPIETIFSDMSMEYADFNQVESIELPEEAKTAATLPLPATEDPAEGSADSDTHVDTDADAGTDAADADTQTDADTDADSGVDEDDSDADVDAETDEAVSDETEADVETETVTAE